jgi:4-hydroxy-tetrahydrodipicolinate synthase
MSQLVHSYLEGDPVKAREIHYELLPLFKSLFLETNPGPVKAAMDILGRPAGEPRLPLVEATDETKNKLEQVLNDLGLKS